MSLGQSIRSGVKWLALGNVARRFLEFAYGVILARLLVPADFGMIVTVQVFTGVVGLFATGGMGQALIRAKHANVQDFTAIFTYQLIIGILIYLSFFLAAPLIAEYLADPIYKDLIRVSALIFILRPYTMIRNAWFSRRMQFKILTYTRMAGGFLTGLFSVVMAWFGLGVWSLTLSGLFSTLIMNMVMAHFIPFRLRFNPDLAIIRRHAAFGIKITANDFLTYSRREAKNLLISKLAGPSFLGLFNKAESMARLPNQLIMPATMEPLFRGMSKVQDDLDQTRYLFHRGVGLLMAYTAPAYAILWWVAPDFIYVVYGEKWSAAGAPMSILALAGFFLNIIYPCGVVLAVCNRLGEEMAAQTINLVMLIAACYIGLDWGLVGVAWGIVITHSLLATHLYMLVRRTLRLQVGELARAVLPGLATSVLVFGVLAATHFLLPDTFTEHPVLSLVAMSASGGLCFALAFLFTPFPALQSEAQRWKHKLSSGLGLLTSRNRTS